ncbi:MAG: acyl carrier protein [Acutalibacteraceae bacterium]|nr:acyl carrier protein [Acutalibacteraceae bacterium]
MLETLREVICRYADLDPSKLTEETNIRSELGLNSLELINIASAIEDEFDVEIPDREVGNIETIGDAIKIIQKYMED